MAGRTQQIVAREPNDRTSHRQLACISVACGRVNFTVGRAYLPNVKRKDAKQIIRDSGRRPRMAKLGFAMFFVGILLLLTTDWLGNHQTYLGGVPATDLALFLGSGVLVVGWIMAALSLRCPICDSGVGKNGICRGCGRNRLERHFHIEDLKQRGVSQQYRRFNSPGTPNKSLDRSHGKRLSHHA
jgi:predicted Fe-S protein YdhL (DUF1289 family)